MKGTSAKRSSLFLLELIIAILFFSLTSAVCVQIFVRAHLISRQTQELNTALEKGIRIFRSISCRGFFFRSAAGRCQCLRKCRRFCRISRILR